MEQAIIWTPSSKQRHPLKALTPFNFLSFVADPIMKILVVLLVVALCTHEASAACKKEKEKCEKPDDCCQTPRKQRCEEMKTRVGYVYGKYCAACGNVDDPCRRTAQCCQAPNLVCITRPKRKKSGRGFTIGTFCTKKRSG